MDINPTSDVTSTPVPQHTDTAPASSTGASFAQALGSVVNVAGQLASTVAGGGSLGAGPLIGSIAGNLNGNSGTDFGDQSFQSLLLQQEQIRESAAFTALTNISKTEYDTRMSAIRNMRGG